jgi:hypothetical protein
MGTQVDWSGYDNWLNKDNPYENYTDEDEDETCELCGEDLSNCQSECHQDIEGGGYCDCQNSDCTNPTPKG